MFHCSTPCCDRPRAFTLIELLIVVAIIAILAAIAVPNFLEAQTRAKVARVRSDLRTVATALESYRTDNNRYPPNDGVYNVLPVQITSPVAYLTTGLLADPFTDKERLDRPGTDPELARFYTYNVVVSFREAQMLAASGRPVPPEAIDSPAYNRGAYARYGPWRLLSNGPDRRYSGPGTHPMDEFNPNPSILLGADIPYDPTNGSVSFGNLLRTQRKTD